MKKILLGIAMVISIGSCSTDNDNSPTSENSLLIANWTYSHKYQNENYYEPTLCAENDQLIFSSDLTWQGEYFTKNESGNCYNDEEELGTWKRDGNELTLYYVDMGEEYDSDIYKIQKLTENELELRLEFDNENYHIYAYKR